MAQQLINIGAVANDGTGDTWRDAMDKSNDNFTELYGLTASGKRVVVNSIADFPAAVAGVITLAANTQYLILEDIDFGTTRLAWGVNTVIRGVDSFVVTLSYSGTGSLFTFSDTGGRISGVRVDAPLGSVFDWTDTGVVVLVVSDFSITNAQSFGTFNGTNGIIRFSNIGFGSLVNNALTFTGNFFSVLIEVAFGTIAAGNFFNLGTATFDNLTINGLLATLNGSSVFLAGAAASANINSGFQALVLKNVLAGTGSALSGIAADDSRWRFEANNGIPDTRPRGIVTMQSNATNTVVSVISTYVLVAGTWAVGATSQFTATTGGRLTYDGEPDTGRLIIARVTMAPVTGGAQTLSLRIAIKGVTVATTQSSASVASGSSTSVTTVHQHSFQTDDYVEIFVANDSTTNDVLVSASALSVS